MVRAKRLGYLFVVAMVVSIIWSMMALKGGRSELMHSTPVNLKVTSLEGEDMSCWAGGRMIRHRLRLDHGWEIYRLAGQLSNRKFAIIIDSRSSTGSSSQFVATLDGSEAHRISGLPKSTDPANLSTTHNSILAPALENGALVVRTLSENGKPGYFRTLKIPGEKIVSLLGPLSVSRDGLVVAALTTQRNDTPTIYLFRNGRGPLVIGSGYFPVLTQDSRKVGYVRAEPGGGLSASYEVAVFDVRFRFNKVLTAWKPTHPTELIPFWMGHPEGPVSVQWSSDGRYLVCALMLHQHYEQMLVALDTGSKAIRRYVLPLRIDRMRWLAK